MQEVFVGGYLTSANLYTNTDYQLTLFWSHVLVMTSVFPAMKFQFWKWNWHLVRVHKYLTYLSHSIPSHRDDKYGAVTVTLSGKDVTTVAAYVPPSARFSEQRREHIIRSTLTFYIVPGDFNGHNTALKSRLTTLRGKNLLAIADHHKLRVLNDGSVTFYRGI